MVAQRYIRVSCLVVAMVCLAGAQELRHITNDEARTHLTKDVVAEYPSMAAGMGLYGVVNLEITITDSGYVYTDPKAVKGDPILVQAALRAVKQWEFRPFMVKGKPVWVRAAILVDFSPGSVAVLRAQFGELMGKCDAASMSHWSEAGILCEQALESATKLPKRFIHERERAYFYAGTAAYNLKKVDVALKYFKQQLALAEQIGIPPFSSYMILMHSNLAHAYEDMGKLREADVEYTAAEKSQENSLADVESRWKGSQPYMYNALKTSYGHKLRIILEDHARVLRRMGKTGQVEIVERRAAALPESNGAEK